MRKSPCKGCERRTVRPNCHGNCKDYVDFVNERNQYNADQRKAAVIAEYLKDKKMKKVRR